MTNPPSDERARAAAEVALNAADTVWRSENDGRLVPQRLRELQIQQIMYAVAQAIKERDKWKKAYDGLLAEADRQGPPMYSAILARADQQAEEIARLHDQREANGALAQKWLAERDTANEEIARLKANHCRPGCE